MCSLEPTIRHGPEVPVNLWCEVRPTSWFGAAGEQHARCDVPVGKVKFYSAEKGFGFVSGDDGDDVFLPASALPNGVTQLRGGTRIEYSIAQGRKGAQAMHVTVLDAPPSIAERKRKPADQMVVIVEDVIRLLDDLSAGLQKGRYPDRSHSNKIATVLRAVADDLEV